MTARVFSTWNPHAVGDGLGLQQGNVVITTLVSGLSNARKVLGTLPKGLAPAFYETVFYSVPMVSLSDNVATGLAKPTSPLNEAVGHDADSCGYYPATGEIKKGNTVLTTLDPIDERTDIGIYMTIGGLGGNHAFMNVITAGVWRYAVDLGAGSLWVPAQTLAGGNATETSSYTRFGGGGVAFNYPRIVAPPT